MVFSEEKFKGQWWSCFSPFWKNFQTLWFKWNKNKTKLY